MGFRYLHQAIQRNLTKEPPMMKLKPRAGLALCALSIWTATASADAVTDWNEITMAAVTASQPGPVGRLDVALVHVAIHDAVQAIEKRYEPYHVAIPGAKGSRSAAVAAAAHDVLAGIYPEPEKVAVLDATYDDYLARHGLANDPGLEVGRKAAAGILPLRGNARKPLSERYPTDYEGLKALGALVRTVRTPEQTDLAHFHDANSFAKWNRDLRRVAEKRLDSIGDTARLFALANTVQYTYDGRCRLAVARQYTELFRIQLRCEQSPRRHRTLQVKNED
jgi:hypothetical protein